MPSYGKENFKESNVNYINKDFATLKTSLMNFAKSYFPNSYRDFNESSPGMMLLEMNAYVGDVLSFYIDQQYREMLLPLSEERRNIMNMAKMFGYKVKPIVPAYVDLQFSFEAGAMSDDSSKVDYNTCATFDKGVRVRGLDEDIIFETLDVLDFKITSSVDTSEVSKTDEETGLATGYMLHRNVKSVSAVEKSKTFKIGSPEKFKKIVLKDTNVVDIISCVDSNGNNWYEVDYLAQDKVPISTHYTEEGRTSAYQNLSTGENENLPVPYSLSYIKTSKRFTRETNVDNTTSLIFGNGILKDGNLVDDGYIDLEQVGIVVPGQTNDLSQAIDPLLGDEYSTLGETPSNTTLTITYRVGGGINANVPGGELSSIILGTTIGTSGGDISQVTVTNPFPARGGKNQESIDEIREQTKAFFTTQNRCVTKEDYEARVLNIPSKFGNIAKVYVARNEAGDIQYNYDDFKNTLQFIKTNNQNFINFIEGISADLAEYSNNQTPVPYATAQGFSTLINGNLPLLTSFNDLYSDLDQQAQMAGSFELSAINIYILAYDNNKNLVGNPIAGYANADIEDGVPPSLMQNIKKYLANYKILTDTVQILNGYIVNFGVFFDVVAEKYADKQQVKLNCIRKIENYFRIEKMQFNQPIFISQLEFELMDVEGVRSVNHVTVSQHKDYHPNSNGEELNSKTWLYSYSDTVDVDGNPDNGLSGGFEASEGGTLGYGYKYDFENALEGGVIRPPLPSSPTVFELKNPRANIKGRVR